jgi:hypothetical protein
MADAQIGHLCYNIGRQMRGLRHDAHACPPKKEKQIMSEVQENQTPKKTSYMGLGLAIGIALGAAMGLALDNMAFMGAGLAIGVAIGAGLDQRHKRDDA